jgi:acylphosphatase
MKAVHIYISGRVQGVGFRQFIHAEATSRGVGGWARNLSDGRVEAVLVGEDAAVDEMVIVCHRGPPGAIVRGLTKEPYAGPLDSRFVLRPTA